MATDLFDIHIKISKENSGVYCAKTVIGNNTMVLERFNTYLTNSICDLVVDMDTAGLWAQLALTPSLSRWPFGASSKVVPAGVPTSKPGTKPTTTTTKKKQVPTTLQRPVDLTSVPSPTCKPICQAYDLFGGSKCKALCQSKKGV